jgi:hypothetical protein
VHRDLPAGTVTVDWGVLAARTRTYDVLDCQRDPAGQTTDVVAVGLRLSLSDLAKRFSADHASSLLVYADTLDVDVAELPAPFSVIVARVLNVTGPLRLAPPSAAHPTTAAHILTPAALTLTTAEDHRFPVPASDVPTARLFQYSKGDVPTVTSATDAATIGDLTGRPYALNALQATFSAATRLANRAGGQSTARDMLSWIIQVTTPAGATATEPTPWAQLHDQAQALLISLMVDPGARYVPALSSAYYQEQLAALLDTLDSYDASLNTLATAGDVAAAITAVAATTTRAAADELAPLQTELSSLDANLKDLNTGINTLNLQFQMQQSTVGVAWAKFKLASADSQIKTWFTAWFSLGLSAIEVGFDAVRVLATSGDPTAWKGVVTQSVGAVQTAVQAIQDVSADVTQSQKGLVDAASKLFTMQQQLVVAYASAQAPNASAELGTAPSVFAVDPATAWDNYLAEVSTALGSLPEAGQLLVALTTLANYGKALAAKIAVATGLSAQRTLVESRIAATKAVAAEWKKLSAAAQDEGERKAALSGLIGRRRDTVMRSLFTAWTNYGAAYRYVYLQQPPVNVNVDMSTGDLRKALADTIEWVGRVTGDSTRPHITLPDTDVKVALSFPIVRSSDDVAVGTALYTHDDAAGLPFLTWTIPWGTDQLEGVLPDEVAVWVTAARFWVDGVTPNYKHRVLFKVSTSGTYQNGFDEHTLSTFVSRGMTGNYAYQVGSEADPYNPWTIPTEVTMIPTPFTQWTLTFDPDGGNSDAGTLLHMECTVTYRPAP